MNILRKNSNQMMKWLLLLCVVSSSYYLLASRGNDSKEMNFNFDHNPIDRANGASYATMLEEAQKSVVSVYTAELVQYLRYGGSSREEALREFLGFPPRGRRGSSVETHKIPQGVGSGVILNSEGYIITNNHVISNKQNGVADEILVRLNNGEEYKAKVVGRDPKTDVAVLKINAVKLPFAKIADSEETKVGDIVFAIGNPMGVGLTVTSGIISAKNRNIGIYGLEGYENFIQTDASINPGNSGGALVDIKGRLIGINSAIVSRSGGNVGIGFAIPSNLAVDVSSQLIKTGKVNRKKIGVYISPILEEEAQQLGLSKHSVVIQRVLEGSAAAQAGLESGDIITHIHDRAIQGIGSFRSSVAHLKKGGEIVIRFWRNNQKHRVSLSMD